MSVAVSRDLVRWGKVRTVFYPDELDAGWPDIDHFRPFFHNGLFLANAAYVDPSGGRFGQLRFMWSRDGFRWQQAPDRAWFIPRGPEGHFDDGWILGASAPVPVGHQMWFYYGGQPLQMQVAGDRGSAVGLAKLPRDRFVSLKAEGEPGFLLTREVRIAGNELRINCATGQRFPSLTGMAVLGDIRVELVESLPARQAVVGGRPVPGFTMEDCDPIRTNRIDHRVTWKGTVGPERAARPAAASALPPDRVGAVHVRVRRRDGVSRRSSPSHEKERAPPRGGEMPAQRGEMLRTNTVRSPPC